jgi:hypothetical protein
MDGGEAIKVVPRYEYGSSEVGLVVPRSCQQAIMCHASPVCVGFPNIASAGPVGQMSSVLFVASVIR